MEMEPGKVLRALAEGEVVPLGMMPWSSNYTFLVQINDEHYSSQLGDTDRPVINVDGEQIKSDLLAVYKPRKGETPLWDFPEGTLCQREQAAYLVSSALGWNVVPPTVLRNGPQGFGSLQLFINADPNHHYFNFREKGEVLDDLQRLVLFDLMINNADRKSGHCLLDDEGHVWGIDHGITFNTEYKVRTVIWDFANELIPTKHMADMQKLQTQITAEQPLAKAMRQLLSGAEVKAFRRRLEGLIELGHFPQPSRNQRSVPWPPV